MTSAGHQLVEHTADIMIEAWAGSRAECAAEAMRALLGAIEAPAEGDAPVVREVSFSGTSDEDLLVQALQEVIYLLDAHGLMLVDVDLHDEGDELAGELALLPVDREQLAGASPKAVTYHDLHFAKQSEDAWSCRVIVDV